MSRLELVAGNFGSGRADWINHEFHLPKKQRLPIEAICSVEENGEYLERSVLGFFKGGASGALGLGTAAAVVGVFAAPLAAVGAIGLTAAAIGGGLGAFGGSVERKILLQVLAADGRGFVAICEQELATDIRKSISVAHSLRMRAKETEVVQPPPAKWRTALLKSKTEAAATPIAALPAPNVTQEPQQAVVDLQPDASGIFSLTGTALASTAESAGTMASEAYSTTTEAIGGAWLMVRARLPWSQSDEQPAKPPTEGAVDRR